jgi:hypothetical protein
VIPFTVEQFFDVFEQYNLAVWPMQAALVFLAGVLVLLAIRPNQFSDRVISFALACLWLWSGAVYHLIFFRRINPTAVVFGALFISQALIFFLTGVIKRELTFQARWSVAGIIGGLFIGYALIIYPALGQLQGHIFPRSPTFGAPCPATIFTFGLLLWTEKKIPQFVLWIPLLWSLAGLTAAISFGILEDFGLIIAGMTGTGVLLWRNRHSANSPLVTFK